MHDNRFENTRCDAINLATVDPSRGAIEIYNNTVINGGTGPHPNDGAATYWVIANLKLLGHAGAVNIQSNWRVVGNDIQCPGGDGAEACAESPDGSYITFLGNEVHNAGKLSSTKMYHAVYFSTNSNFIEVGWNYIHDNLD